MHVVARHQFENTPEANSVRLEENGQHILSMRVEKRGIVLPDHKPTVTYSVKDRTLIRTVIPQAALERTAMGAGGASLEIGLEHPVARSLRELDVDPKPVFTRSFLDRTAILREGEIVERDVRPLDGYRGKAREQGILRDGHPPAIALH